MMRRGDNLDGFTLNMLFLHYYTTVLCQLSIVSSALGDDGSIRYANERQRKDGAIKIFVYAQFQ